MSYRKSMKVAKMETANDPEELRNSKLRALVVSELITTEGKYVEDLATFFVVYGNQIKVEYASQPEMAVLIVQFSTMEQIYELNRQFFRMLSPSPTGPVVPVGEIMRAFI
ncbi:hypothetical protein Pelo_13542 [Pelomyxa schiedti]|nr:hypothetical protein Pelo_13542 [Pelomyxa schiedti]